MSVSGYYAWRERGLSLRQQTDERLGRAITRVFQASRQTYGSHRVYQALPHHDALLASSALDMAIRRQRPNPGLIVHSDRGSEFANAHFHHRAARIRLSMSGTGNCYDNAAAESFCATVKLEAVRR